MNNHLISAAANHRSGIHAGPSAKAKEQSHPLGTWFLIGTGFWIGVLLYLVRGLLR